MKPPHFNHSLQLSGGLPSSYDICIFFIQMWEKGSFPSQSSPGFSRLLSSLPVAFRKLPLWARKGQRLAMGYAESQCEAESCHFKLQTRPVRSYQAHSLSCFLSMPREVKSLPGMPPSPAPAVATFSQAPCQPQASQTLTPLAVQAAPQVRATPGNWTEGSGQAQGMG